MRFIRWIVFWPLRVLFRFMVRLIIVAGLLALLAVLVFRAVPPPTTYYIMAEYFRLGAVSRDWVALTTLPPHIPAAFAAAEDARFCDHWGIDVDAVQEALADDTRLRGGSTITQQVAKNLFLWPERSWLRKGLEAGFAIMMEWTWPKARIMEMYLNIAETGEGIFGVEAAARYYFNRPAADLTLDQAARIAAILPNPKARNPVRLTSFMTNRVAGIVDGAQTLQNTGRAGCFTR